MRLQSMTFAALIVALVLSSVSAQEPPSLQRDFTLKVSLHPDIEKKDKSIQQAYQKVADQLTALRIGVPADRLAYFQNHPSPPPERATGWDGTIVNMTAQRDGGLIVLMTVQPYYDGALSNLCVYERYLIKDGKAKYLGNAPHPSANRIVVIG